MNKINNIMQINCNSVLTEKLKYTKGITGSRNSKDRQYNGIKIQEYKANCCFFWSVISLTFCIVFCFVLFVFFSLFVLCLMSQCCPCLFIVHCWSYLRVSLIITISNRICFTIFARSNFCGFMLEY